MRDMILRLGVYTAAIAIVAAILPGIHVQDNDVGTLLVVAIIFALVNTFIKPVIQVLSCPLVLLTLGLFALIINGLLLLLTDALAGDRFAVDGFWWAVLGGLVISIVIGFLEGLLGLKDDDKGEKTYVIRS